MSALSSVEAPLAPSPRRHLSLVPNVSEPSARRMSHRVYARRRFAALLVLLVVVGGAMMATKAFASTDGGVATVTVKSGETLSDVAHAKLPDLPVAQAVTEFQVKNNLNSTHVEVGETLLVPAA